MVDTSQLPQLAGYLQQTLDPGLSVRRAAEKFLESVETSPGFPMLLLTAVESSQVEPPIQMAAAIAFKNLLRRQWTSEDSKLSGEDRAAVKHAVVDLMLRAPDNIQRLLSEGIAIIADHDFPQEWDDLLPHLVSKFSTPDFNAINGVLRTASPLFRRYTGPWR